MNGWFCLWHFPSAPSKEENQNMPKCVPFSPESPGCGSWVASAPSLLLFPSLPLCLVHRLWKLTPRLAGLQGSSDTGKSDKESGMNAISMCRCRVVTYDRCKPEMGSPPLTAPCRQTSPLAALPQLSFLGVLFTLKSASSMFSSLHKKKTIGERNKKLLF